MVRQAVILAAGMGSRLRANGAETPKPLVRVGGLPLLQRTLLALHRAGVDRFAVVLGYQGEQVRAALENEPALAECHIEWINNPHYELANGVSVLQARDAMEPGDFLLTMCDHVVDPAIYQVLQNENAHGGLVLAVDRKLDTIFDMDDATKVKVDDRNHILSISKKLTDYDAIDTGVFLCDHALFDALQDVYTARGDASLSDGVQALASVGKAFVADVGTAWWQDVDDARTRDHAEKLLFKSLTKPIDGPVSKHINRKFSKTITRMVMNHNVVPNHMTLIGLIIGVASAILTALVSPGSLWLIPLGGVLYQLSSMIDGCDGEIARLKYKNSASGEWFDTISDDVVNLFYQLAVGYAVYNLTGNVIWLHISIASFVLGWVVAINLYHKLLTSGKGTHLALKWFDKPEEQSLIQRAIQKLQFFGHRDTYALCLMVFSFFGVPGLQFGLICSIIVVAFVTGQWLFMIPRNASQTRRENTSHHTA